MPTETTGDDSPALAERALEWLGAPVDQRLIGRLEAYATWLVDEAVPAGGLGPREAARVWGRHIGDSLVFAHGWPADPPHELLDVGSGVGLPGIPLAMLWPDTHVTLLDRGGRRTRLLHRAVRVLALDNVLIAQGDVFDVADEWDGVAFRGSVKAQEAVGLSARLLDVPGTAVLGLSRREEPPERSHDLVGIAEALGMTAHIAGVPPKVLDGAAWLLIMRFGD